MQEHFLVRFDLLYPIGLIQNDLKIVSGVRQPHLNKKKVLHGHLECFESNPWTPSQNNNSFFFFFFFQVETKYMIISRVYADNSMIGSVFV